MRVLIAEDDFASRLFLFKFLSSYAECDLTSDGAEAVEAFHMAHDTNEPYDLICLDIMMPKVDGLMALQQIREMEDRMGIEQNKGVKVIMTTALSDTDSIESAINAGCGVYLTKPIDTDKFIASMRELGLIN